MNVLEQRLVELAKSHNRQCWLGAFTSLFGAWFAWVLLYAFFGGVILLLETVRTGVEAVHPAWLTTAFFALVGVLFLWGGWDRWRNRFRSPGDRPIIGWHLFPDVLLIPVRLTFAIADHLDARTKFYPWDLPGAARLIEVCLELGKLPVSSLQYHLPNSDDPGKILNKLQLLGVLDLHQGMDEWFYKIPGLEEPVWKSLLNWERKNDPEDFPPG